MEERRKGIRKNELKVVSTNSIRAKLEKSTKCRISDW